MALIDVVMPVRNGAAFIRQAIASVQAQTVRDWRLLVLDHGSTDETADIVDGLARADARIERHPLPDAPGLAGLLNEGLALVQAPLAMRMDADDECLPDRMALTRAAFAANPGVVLIGGQAITIDAEGRTLGKLASPCERDVLTRRVMFRSTFAHPTVCFDSQRMADMGLRYGVSIFRATDPLATIEVPNLAEDYLLFGELAINGQAINVPQNVLRYRMHPGGVSRAKYADQLRLSAHISRHFADVICRRAGVPTFDPVPFCTHAQTLIDVGDSTDYREAHARMKASLALVGSVWKDEREVKWREVFVDRSWARIGLRALTHYPGSGVDEWEVRTVANTVKGMLRRRKRIHVPPGVANVAV